VQTLNRWLPRGARKGVECTAIPEPYASAFAGQPAPSFLLSVTHSFNQELTSAGSLG